MPCHFTIFAVLQMREVTTIDYQQKYQELQGQYEVLKAELMQLKRLIFASRQERFLPTTDTPASAAQLSLDITAAPLPATVVSTAVKKMEYTKEATMAVQTTLEHKQ